LSRTEKKNWGTEKDRRELKFYREEKVKELQHPIKLSPGDRVEEKSRRERAKKEIKEKGTSREYFRAKTQNTIEEKGSHIPSFIGGLKVREKSGVE